MEKALEKQDRDGAYFWMLHFEHSAFILADGTI